MQAELTSAGLYELVSLGRHHARFLRFLASIYLDKCRNLPTGPIHLPRERPGEFRTINGLDDIEQLKRGPNLVGLQRSDEVKPDIWMGRFQPRPFGHGLLDTVFPENPLTGQNRSFHDLGREGLADGHQGYVASLTTSRRDGIFDRVLHRNKVCGDVDGRVVRTWPWIGSISHV